MCRFLALSLLLALPALTGAAQSAVVQEGDFNTWMGDNVWVVDPRTCTYTSCAFAPAQQSRGLTVGYDGAVYAGWWTVNGIGRLDLNTCAWTTVYADPTNLITGAPYQPVVNNEAVGGPGLWFIDGNSPVPKKPWRNTALVDIRGGTATLVYAFPNTFLPMSDAYAHPLKAETFIGVAWGPDQLVTLFPLKSTTLTTPGILASLAMPVAYDAFIHQDCALYMWTSRKNFVGFQRVDLLSGRYSTCRLPLSYIGPGGYAAVWNDPWELPGQQAYILYSGDDKIYTVDLQTCTVVTVCKLTLPGKIWGEYGTGRELQENQLTSWLTRAGGPRVFHLNFGPARGGKSYVLIPSLRPPCVAKPLLLGQLELWFDLDPVSLVGLTGGLPYVPVGTLDRSGQADVGWALNQVGVTAWWIAGAFDRTGVVDLSNVICVKM